MPVSSPEALSDILQFIRKVEPKSLLDIGVGFGKMGVLFREAMDIRWGRYENWQGRIDGVEIFGGYANPIWSYIYDHLWMADVRNLAIQDYGVIFLGDVIEHLEKSEALKLLEKCYAHAKYVVVTTPMEMNRTREPVKLFGNQHEQHLSFLEDSDFPKEAKITHYIRQKLIIITC